MRLADFIAGNVEPILVEWEAFARSITPAATMDALALRDHAGEILLATVDDMRSAQSAAQRTARSHGERRDSESPNLNRASELHAIGRLGSGFDLVELVSEYRALRSSVLRLWHESASHPCDSDVDDITRFNESIDQSLAKAVSSYTRRVDQSRDLYLGILSHDLRNPLNSIAISASLLTHMFQPTSQEGQVATQIATNAVVMGRMISDLLDYTRTRLGTGMPVSPAPMELRALCQDLHNEFRGAHPHRKISLRSEGDSRGHWDSDRLRQAISNLLGNALQHSPEDASVELRLSGKAAEVVLTVFNEGPPIPPGDLSKIFDPLVRGSNADHHKANRPGSVGLGLYITHEIVASHGGEITVTSTDASGTCFIVRLPRENVSHSRHASHDEQHAQSM